MDNFSIKSTINEILKPIIKFVIVTSIILFFMWRGSNYLYSTEIRTFTDNNGTSWAWDATNNVWFDQDDPSNSLPLGQNPEGYDFEDTEAVDVYDSTDINNAIDGGEENAKKRRTNTQNAAKKAADYLLHPSHLLSDMVQGMASELIEGLGALLSCGAVDAGDSLVKGMVGQFGPSLDTFKWVLSGGSLKNYDYRKKYTIDTPETTKFDNVAKATGFALATLILVISLFLYFVAEPGSIKDTPLRLFVRYIIALVLIFNSLSVMEEFLDVGNNLWTDYVMSTAIDGQNEKVEFTKFMPVTDGNGKNNSDTVFSQIVVRNNGTGGYGGFIDNTVDDLSKVDDIGIFGIKFFAFNSFLPMLAFLPIIAIICVWPLLKNFFKFYIEIIERYLVVCLLALLFGAAASTVVSKNSSQVIKSYFQMLASQIFLLFMNLVFMSVFIDVLQNGGWTSSLPNYIFALAYLRVCQQLDSYMARLGLSVAQTGGRTMDCLAGTVRNFAGAIGGATRAVRGGAGAIGESAMRNGDSTGGALATAMSKGFVGGVASIASAGGLQNYAADLAGKTGNKANVSPNKAKNIFDSMFSNPNGASKGRFAALSEKSQLSAANSFLGSMGMRADSLDTSRLNSGQIGFTGKTSDGKAVSGTIAAGSGKAEAKNLKFEKGASFKGENMSELGAKTGTADTLNAAVGAGTLNEGAVSSMESLGDGCFAVMGDIDKETKMPQQLGSVMDIDGEQSFVAPCDMATMANDESARSRIEADNNFVPGSLTWNRSSLKDGQIEGTAKLKDDFNSERSVKVMASDLAMLPHKTRASGATVSRLNMGNAVAIQHKDLQPVSTAASRRKGRAK